MKKKNIFIIISCSIVITTALFLSLFFSANLQNKNEIIDYGDEEALGDIPGCESETKSCASGEKKDGDFCYSGSKGRIPSAACTSSGGTLATDGICYANKNATQSKCTRCRAGYFLSSGSCIMCSPGTYSQSGATSCSRCSEGTYQDQAGQSRCNNCQSNFYQNQKGQIRCIQAPTNSTVNSARTGFTCNNGYVLSGNECKALSLNVSCSMSSGNKYTCTASYSPSVSLTCNWSVSGGSISTSTTTGTSHSITVSNLNTGAEYDVSVTCGGRTVQTGITPTGSKVNVTGINVTCDKYEIYEGESTSCRETITPADASEKGVTWTSENSSIATVNGGSVEAKREGTVTITATSKDNSSIKKSVTIKVKKRPNGCTISSVSTSAKHVSVSGSYEVNVSFNGDCNNKTVSFSANNGTPSKSSATISGNTVSFTVNPNRSCEKSKATATLSGQSKSTNEVEVKPDWQVVGTSLCVKNPTYTSSKAADDAGADEYYDDYGKCNNNDNAYRRKWSRSCNNGGGGGGNTPPPNTPPPNTPSPPNYACYTDSHKIQYRWASSNPGGGWTILNDRKSEDECKACFRKGNDYMWTDKIPGNGWILVDTITSEADCPTTEIETYACYADEEKIEDATRAAWRKKESIYYPYKIEIGLHGNVITKDNYRDECVAPERESCYRNIDGELYWDDGPRRTSDIKMSYIDEDDCNNKNICTQGELKGKDNTDAVCKNIVESNKIGSNASCKVNSEYFYKIQCVENHVAGFLPKLEGLAGDNAYKLIAGLNGLALGFGSSIDLNSSMVCSGSFDIVKYNEAYDRLKNNRDKANKAGDLSGYWFFKDKMNELSQFVSAYNDYYNQYSSSYVGDKKNVTGTITFKYNKGSKTYNYEVVEKPEPDVTTKCRAFTIPEINNITDSMKCSTECSMECTTTDLKEEISKNCATKTLKEDIQKCSADVQKSCQNKCEIKNGCNNTLNKSSENCRETSLNGGDSVVSPFTMIVNETYKLKAPEVFLEKNGRIAKTQTDSPENVNGGRKFYLDDIEVGSNYEITMKIDNLGMNNSSITNKNCKFQVVDGKQDVQYRIIENDNPFVNAKRYESMNNNWKNNTFDFTKIINNNNLLYTFNLSKADIQAIKADNSSSTESYNGVCSKKINNGGTIGKICKNIYSK